MREAATIERSVVLSGVEKRRALISQAKARWGSGQPADAQAVLAQHPELAQDRNAVVELVFEEFALRRQAGEKLDPVEFAERFSGYKTSLRKVLVMHEAMEGNPHLLPVGDADGWPAPGEDVLGFSVVSELGRGSFARVYLATQPSLGNRRVAVKVARSGGGAEAHILGQLTHDGIVPIHSVQEDALTGWTIVCMPYFGKATLEDVLDRAFAKDKTPTQGRIILDAARPPAGMEPSTALKPPSPTLESGGYIDAITEIGVQLAEALAFAHARKIYHRDVKPSNVLVGPDGRPRLLDFNLSFDAKQSKELLGGTLIYMSPEQLRATDPQYAGPPELLDARSDLYSLGVILFELLTGKHPFGPIPWKLPQHEVRRELLRRQERGPARLSELNPRVDRALAEVMARCLAWKPEARFASAEELAEALRRCLKRGAARASRVRKLLVAALLLVTTGGFGAYYAHRASANEAGYEQALQAYNEGRFWSAHDILNRAIERDQEPARVLFLRARASMKMANWEAAQLDLLQADKLQPDGKTKAVLAYCYANGKHPRYDLAYLNYTEALKSGYKTAVVLNNLGDCCFPTKNKGKSTEALAYLQQAVDLNPELQIAYHNIVIAEIAMAANVGDYVPEKGRVAADHAVKLGPVNGHLYRDCAIVYALAAARNPLAPDEWKKKAVMFVTKAVEYGFSPSALNREDLLTSLHTEPGYEQALKTPATSPLAPRPSYAVNPLGDQ